MRSFIQYLARTCVVGGLLAVTVLGAAVPQSSELVELEKKLAAVRDSERVSVLLEIAEKAESADLNRAFAAAKEAEQKASKLVDRLTAQAAIASMLRQRTEYHDALALANKGLEEATKLNDDRLRGRFHYVIARTQWSLADYPASVASFHQSIRAAERAQDMATLADAHTGIVTIYTEFKQPADAELHLTEARKYVEALDDSRRLGDFYRVLGNQLHQKNDWAGARAAHEKSREINLAAGNVRGVADALQNVGFVDETQGNYDLARRQFEEAIAIYEKLGLKRHLINAHRQLGRVLGRQKRTEEGLAHIQKSLDLAKGVGAPNGIALAYRDRAIVYEVAGKLKEALEDQRQLQVQNESIFGERSRQQIAVLTARFESERHQHQIDLLRREQALKDAELARARWQRVSLLGALALGGVAIGMFISRQRLKQAAERRALADAQAAREAAQSADALKTKLVGIASHDLKSPVAAMIGGAEALQREPADAKAVAELARLMEHEGRRMLGLIRDLLDMAALERGRLELSREIVDVVAVVQQSVALLQTRARAKQQELSCHIVGDTSNASIEGDHGRLRQVVDNLVDNAIKFTPAGKKVSVTAEFGGGVVRVAVADEGPGLTPEDYVRLFQPFQKLSAQPTAGESSSGLGLSIAREIVAMHGGQMIVDSVPGGGATFSFELPLVVPERAGRSIAEAAARESGATPMPA